MPFETLRKGVQNEIGRLRRHQFITTMVDLHGIRDFLGDQRVQRDDYKRLLEIENAMANEFSNSNVIPDIQLHEFETLVFEDLEQLNRQ